MLFQPTVNRFGCGSFRTTASLFGINSLGGFSCLWNREIFHIHRGISFWVFNAPHSTQRLVFWLHNIKTPFAGRCAGFFMILEFLSRALLSVLRTGFLKSFDSMDLPGVSRDLFGFPVACKLHGCSPINVSVGAVRDGEGGRARRLGED